MKKFRSILMMILSLAMVLSLVLPAYGEESVPLAREAEAVADETVYPEGVGRGAAARQKPTKEAIAAKWATVTTATSLYVEEPSVTAPYKAGKLTDNLLESGLTYFNYIRFVAGLPEVTLDETLTGDAQHGAVLLAALNQLSHTPPKPADMDSAFYKRGYGATSTANISARWGYAPLTCLQHSIQGCLDDNGDNNLSTLGHRRWILNPTLGKVGFGYAESTSGWSFIVTPVFDRSGVGCDYDFISWPMAGNHPTNLFNTQNPWSVTLNPKIYKTPSANTVKITITRKSDGKQWSFDSKTGNPTTSAEPYMLVNNQGYGISNCIIFNPGSKNVTAYSGIYEVKVTGIYYSNGTAAELNYEVDFFDVDSVCTDHSYQSAVTEPTCKNQGYTTYTCSVCGDSYVGDYTDPVDHSYADGKCIWCGTGLPCENGRHVPGYSYPYETGFCEYCSIPCRSSGSTVWAIEEDGTMIVYGNGEMYAHDNNWAKYADRVTALVVEVGVTGTIHGFTEFENLVSVSLPEGITCIENGCFGGCTKLKTVNFPESLVQIGSNSFHSCTSLTEIHLPAGLQYFGGRPFGGCTSLTGIWVDEENPWYTNDEFGVLFSKDMTQLVEAPGTLSGHYTILETVNYIEWAAFDGCRQLTGVDLPEGIIWIPMNLFENCTALKSITVPASVDIVWLNAFMGCTGLETVIFEGNAPDFMGDSFQNVTATVYYPIGNDTWTEEIMQDYGGNLTWVAMCPEHEYEEGKCVHCGEADPYYVKWYSDTTSLNGTIDLNMYVLLGDKLVNAPNTFVRFTFQNRIVDVPIGEALHAPLANYPNRYRFSCPMFAKQVADQVTVQVMNGNNPVGDPISYSVMQYCNNRIKKSTNANEVAMCKGLLNYATAAQMYFNYNTDNLANASLSDADKRLEKPDLSAHKYSITGEEFGIKAKSATVTMESEIRIRVYFTLTGSKSIEDYTFTIDGVAVQPRYNDKGWYIESEGIAAKHMEVMHDFCVGGITVRYSALSYVNSKLSSKDPLEVELAKALYAYYASAEAFLG